MLGSQMQRVTHRAKCADTADADAVWTGGVSEDVGAGRIDVLGDLRQLVVQGVQHALEQGVHPRDDRAKSFSVGSSLLSPH
jgi:hypothetical protein